MNRYALFALGTASVAVIFGGVYWLGGVVAAAPPTASSVPARTLASLNGRPMMRPHAGPRVLRFLARETAAALNIRPRTLMSDLAAGQTPAAIAVSEGSSASALEATLTTDLTNWVSHAVTIGRLSQTRAAKREARIPTLVDRFVTQQPPRRPRLAPGLALFKDAAQALNLNGATLRGELRQGESLATIAAQHGSSAAALESTLTADVEAALQKAVSAGKMSETRATAIEQHLPARIDRFVTRTFAGHGRVDGPNGAPSASPNVS